MRSEPWSIRWDKVFYKHSNRIQRTPAETPASEKKTEPEENKADAKKDGAKTDKKDEKKSEKKEEKKDETNKKTEIKYPAFAAQKAVDGVIVNVSAPEGAFPEGSTLSVTKLANPEQQKVDNALDQVRDNE